MGSDELLKSACELSYVIARGGVEADPPAEPPQAMRSFLYVADLPERALSAARRAIEDDPAFRRRVAEQATEDQVGRGGYLWLHRPIGWSAEFQELSELVVDPSGDAGSNGNGSSVNGAVPDEGDSPGIVETVPAIGENGVGDPADTHHLSFAGSEGGEDDAPGQGGHSEANAIEDELSSLRGLVDRLASERQAVASSAERMEAQLEGARQQPSVFDTDLYTLRSELEAAREALEEARRERDAAVQQHSSALTRQLELEKELDRARELRATIEREHAESDAGVVELQESLLRTEGNLESAELERHELAAQVESLSAHNEELMTELARLNQERASTTRSVEAEREGYRTQIDALQATKEDLTAGVASVGRQLDETRAELGLVSGQVTENRALVEVLTEEKIDLASRLADTEAMLDTTRTQLNAVKADAESVSAELANTKEHRDGLSTQVEELHGSLTEALDNLARVRATSDADRDALKGLRNDRDQLKLRVSSLEQAESSMEGKLATLTTERSTLATRVDEVRAELAELETTRSALADERDILQGDLGSAREANQVLEAERDTLSSTIAGLRHDLSGLEDERDGLAQQVDQLTAENSAIQDQLVESDRLRVETSEGQGLALSELAHRLSLVETERAKIEDRLGQAEKALSDATESMASAKDAAVSAEADAAAAREQADAAQADADAARAEAEEAKSSASSLDDKFQEARTRAQAAEARAREAETRVDEIEARAVEAEARTEALEAELVEQREAVAVSGFVAQPDTGGSQDGPADLADGDLDPAEAGEADAGVDDEAVSDAGVDADPEVEIVDEVQAGEAADEVVDEAAVDEVDDEATVDEVDDEGLVDEVVDDEATVDEVDDEGLVDEVDEVDDEAAADPIPAEVEATDEGAEEPQASGSILESGGSIDVEAELEETLTGGRRTLDESPPPPEAGDTGQEPESSFLRGLRSEAEAELDDDEESRSTKRHSWSLGPLLRGRRGVDDDRNGDTGTTDQPPPPVIPSPAADDDDLDAIAAAVAQANSPLGSPVDTSQSDEDLSLIGAKLADAMAGGPDRLAPPQEETDSDDLDAISDLISQTVSGFDSGDPAPTTVAPDTSSAPSEADARMEGPNGTAPGGVWSTTPGGRSPDPGEWPAGRNGGGAPAPPSIFGGDEAGFDPAGAAPAGEDHDQASGSRRQIHIPAELVENEVELARHVVSSPDVVLLVDGDSVARMGWPSLPVAQQRDALVSYLADLSASTGAAPDVVFDGRIGEEDALPAPQAVRIRLSTPPTEPTAALDELVDAYPLQWPIAVVTDDERLAASALRRGAVALNNGQLLDLFIAE